MRTGRIATLAIGAALLATARPGAASTWTVPGAVNASGLNGTKFVSDVALTNPGTAPVPVTISFLPAASPNAKDVTLNAGETRVYRNVVDSLFGTSGAGALSIASDEPLLVRARTYNTAASGTYGVSLPVFPDERLLSPGDTGDALWISQDASGSSGYRTNIAVVFPDESGGEATVTVYDADGNERGHQDYSLDTPGLQQFSVGSSAGAVAVARARVAVTRGRAAGYAVVVDNVTGDSSLFAFEDLPGGIQDVLVNGVARANGRNGAFFRTDGRFYNPTSTDATIQVAFHASGNANPSPAAASFTLPAGKIRDVVDVLDSLLSLPVGSAGALRFRSDRPVAILCRTSNVDPSGAKPGTFGSQQRPVPLLSFVTSADAGAAITGIRQDAAFRTNVGLAAGADGASYTLTLVNASGAATATATGSLGAFGWSQPSIQDLFPAVTIPADATLRVKVTAGSLDVFDSSIDNLSGDPVVTPIAALPVQIPSAATIGPGGGSIRSGDGRLTLRVPAGALASSASLSFVTDAANDAPQATGPSYTLSPGGLAFSRPALLELRYGRDDLVGTAAGALGIAFKDGSTWYVVTGGSIDPAARTLAVPVGSTTPATPASRATRSTLADTPRRWSGFRSIQIFPKKAAILTGGKLTLVVLDVGDSSAEPPWLEGVAPNGVSPLSPVDPSRITYTWRLNGLREPGVPADGVLISSSQGMSAANNAGYFAPDCPPHSNPVIVSVDLGVSTAPFPRWTKTVSCAIRVLARDWTFKVTWDQIFSCPGAPAADRVKYVSGFAFSLDESLRATNIVTAPSTTEFFGSPMPCQEDEVDFTRIGTPSLDVTLDSGAYNVDDDSFGLNLAWKIPTALGYNYFTVGNDGTRFPGRYDQGPIVPIPSLPYTRSEGHTPVHIFLPLVGEANLDSDLEHVRGSCP